MKKSVIIIATLAMIAVISLVFTVGYVRMSFLTLNVVKETPQEKMKSEIIEQMEFTGEKIRLVPTDFYNNKGRLIFFGVQNTGNEKMYFKFNHGFEGSHSDPGWETFDVTFDQGCQLLKPGEAKVYDIFIKVKNMGKFGFRAGIIEYSDSSCSKKMGHGERYTWINY